MWLVLTAVLSAGGESAAPRSVRIDWATLSDVTITRCSLEGLQTLLVQGLLEEGMTVTSDSGEFVIELEVAEFLTGIRIRASRLDQRAETVLPFTEPCHESFGLRLQRSAQEMVRRVTQATEDEIEVMVLERLRAHSPTAEPERRNWNYAFTLGYAASVGDDLLDGQSPTLRIGVTRRLFDDLHLGAQLHAEIVPATRSPEADSSGWGLQPRGVVLYWGEYRRFSLGPYVFGGGEYRSVTVEVAGESQGRGFWQGVAGGGLLAGVHLGSTPWSLIGGMDASVRLRPRAFREFEESPTILRQGRWRLSAFVGFSVGH